MWKFRNAFDGSLKDLLENEQACHENYDPCGVGNGRQSQQIHACVPMEYVRLCTTTKVHGDLLARLRVGSIALSGPGVNGLLYRLSGTNRLFKLKNTPYRPI